MDKRQGLLLLPVLLSVTACTDDNDSSRSSCDTPLTVHAATYSDAQGDAAFAFIDLTDMEVSLTEATVEVALTLSAAPVGLTYNSANTPDSHKEYSWAADFDLGNGRVLQMSASHFKFADTIEAVGDAPQFTQNNIWLSDDGAASASNAGLLTATLDGATLLFSAERNALPALTEITSCTPVRFSTTYNAAGQQYHDMFPDNGGYIR